MNTVTTLQYNNAHFLNEIFDRKAARLGVHKARSWVNAKLDDTERFQLIGRLRFTEIYDAIGVFDTEEEAWAAAKKRGGAVHYSVESKNAGDYPSR